MARLNTKQKSTDTTHEGAPVRRTSDAQALRRSVMSCLLWEDNFYESGQEIAKRVADLAANVSPDIVAALAVEARTTGNLRHAPLWLLNSLINRKDVKTPSLVRNTIAATVQRADEMPELLSMYWKGGRRPLSKQLQRGLADAFGKFDAYQLGKYNRDNAISLRDVLRLTHVKPKDDAHAEILRKLNEGTLEAPDTWEVALSGGANKKETFERLIKEGRLGYMALLRSLRLMDQNKVDHDLIKEAIIARKGAHRVLPFRYFSAVKHAPMFADALGKALLAAIGDEPPMTGKTIVMVDTSGSMNSTISDKSEVMRYEIAAVLASMVNGNVRLFHFADDCKELPFYPGLAAVDTVRRSIGKVGHGTNIGSAVRAAERVGYDRLIVISDMQSHDRVGNHAKGAFGYMINVAPYKNSVGYGPWVNIDGFSESTLRFIREYESGTI